MEGRRWKQALAGLALLAVAGVIVAQAPAITRSVVAKADVSVPGREAVVARVEVGPGGTAGWHTHPGDEISYITEGEITLMMAGLPNRVVKAGDGFVIPAGTVHNAKNESSAAVRLVGVYVVEKGKPLASPASAPN
jgi:quercetin dioxygenase-like cupin family protein